MSQGLFTVSVVSLPLNFTILLHPDSITSLGIEENGYALVKGVNGLITVVKVIPDQDCPATGTRITHSVQMTLGASPGDSVPILPFSSREHCEAIQIAPLFDKNSISTESSDFTSAVKQYFAADPRPISVDSIFTLLIDSEERAFKILKCSPTDRSFSSKSTKLYFTTEPGPLLPKPLISKHLNTLVLDKELISFVKNNIYFPVNRQNVLRSLNIPTSTGIIIEGPSGCGKTSLLSAISNTINIPSIYCASKRLKKLNVADYIEKLNQVFGYTAEKPQCLIMFDDIDFIVSSFRQSKLTADRVKLATFFNLLDAVMNRSGVIVIATAISPSTSIDPALLRDGRFGQRIVLNQPTLDQRKELIRLYTGGMRIEDDDLNEIVKKIGGKSDGESDSAVSAKEIERICRVAVTTLIEEATGNQGTEVVDSLAVYTLNTKMKAMHFGVTSTGRSRSRRLVDDEDEDDEESGRHRRRRRRRHRYEDEDEENNQEEDEDEDDGRRRHRRHRRRRRHYEDDDEENNQDEYEDDNKDGSQRRRRRRRHRDDTSSSQRRSHRRSRRRRYEDDEEEDEENNRNEYDEDDEENRRNRSRNRNSRQNRRNRFNEDDEDDEQNDPFSKREKNRRGRIQDDEDDDEEQDSFNRNKRFPARNSKKQSRNNNEDDDEDEDDPFNKKSRKRPPNRGRNEDEEFDEDETNNRRKGSRSKRRNGGRGFGGDDNEDDDEESNPRRSRKRRNFDDEDEDDEGEKRPRNRRNRNVFEDDDEDESNGPPRRRK